jgi:hypothetical protein
MSRTSFGSILVATFAGLLPLSARADAELPPVGTAPYAAPPPACPAFCNCTPLDPRPTYLDCDPSKYVPPGYHFEDRRRKGFLISGAIVLGIGYTVPIPVTATKSQTQSYYFLADDQVPFDPHLLLVPVIGPWAALADIPHYNCSEPPAKGISGGCGESKANIWKAVLVADGLVQLTGATLLVLGLTWPRQQLVSNDYVNAQVVPVRLGSSGHGLAILGTFGGP